MRAFYRAAVGESARPAAARPYRFLTADKLLHELREDDDEAGHGHEPSQRAQPDDPGDEDQRVGKARPDEDLCAEQGHVVGLACHHRYEHQSSEKHEILEHVAVRSRRATSPAGDLGPAVAVTGEPRQANLVERALHRHQHLHHSQRHRPYQKIQLRFHRSSFIVGLRPLWYAAYRDAGGCYASRLLTPNATSSPASVAKSRSRHSTCCDPSDASKANDRVTQSLGPVTDR